MALSTIDPVSYANSEDYVTEHIHFEWNVDFDKHIIYGSVNMTIYNVTKNGKEMKLDTKSLEIEQVLINGVKVEFKLQEEKFDFLGSCLIIPVQILDEKFTVKVCYSTTDKCSALQWLTPEQTCGKKYPYLFSQSQAIHARSLFPCQDSPSVKSTYSAQVKVGHEFNVLMSALKQENPVKEGNYLIHKFDQKIKIPSYLVAIVCGNLEGRKIGKRSTVWSEPKMVNSAAEEFSDTEKFLTIAEELCGPYVWGKYDLLVLPPSFPYGGMENPCLTFVTPTLLVGDKSLTFVIAHEISHSWTGNLVTNMNWEDFWLNEGHTRYVERLIMEKYYDSEKMRHFLIDIGLADLQESLNAFGKDHPFNQLVPNLVECDPDECFSRVPYEKGSNLLFHLETICGKEQMLRWLKVYLDKYKNKSLTTEEWKNFFFEYMTSVEKISLNVLNSVDWKEWFEGRWTIPVKHNLNREFAVKVENLVDKWIQLKEVTDTDKRILLEDYQHMLPEQKYYFLQVMNDFRCAKLDHNVLDVMGTLYGYTSSNNSEILAGWLMLCIHSTYMKTIEQVFSFLNSQGRLKYTKPLYKALHNWPNEEIKNRTKDNYRAMKNSMHPITANMVQQILNQ